MFCNNSTSEVFKLNDDGIGDKKIYKKNEWELIAILSGDGVDVKFSGACTCVCVFT